MKFLINVLLAVAIAHCAYGAKWNNPKEEKNDEGSSDRPLVCKTMSDDYSERCRDCKGSGTDPSKAGDLEDDCQACDGSGNQFFLVSMWDVRGRFRQPPVDDQGRVVEVMKTRFPISRNAALMSELVKHILEGDETATEIDLKNVSPAMLNLIVEYMNHHNGKQCPTCQRSYSEPLGCQDDFHKVPDVLNSFKDYHKVVKSVRTTGKVHDTATTDAAFMARVNRRGIYEVINAADYMDVKSLLHLGCAKIATMIRRRVDCYLAKKCPYTDCYFDNSSGKNDMRVAFRQPVAQPIMELLKPFGKNIRLMKMCLSLALYGDLRATRVLAHTVKHELTGPQAEWPHKAVVQFVDEAYLKKGDAIEIIPKRDYLGYTGWQSAEYVGYYCGDDVRVIYGDNDFYMIDLKNVRLPKTESSDPSSDSEERRRLADHNAPNGLLMFAPILMILMLVYYM